ncbi:MAG TPA: hypothetical protein VFP61_13320 [Acidimicrobiales bacterium]|nr:hypothetical protein [Acidimicrobiales bacterium]
MHDRVARAALDDALAADAESLHGKLAPAAAGRPELGAAALRDVRRRLIDELGELNGIGSPEQLTVFQFPLEFGRGQAQARVTINSAGQVAGLWLHLPSSSGHDGAVGPG